MGKIYYSPVFEELRSRQAAYTLLVVKVEFDLSVNWLRRVFELWSSACDTGT